MNVARKTIESKMEAQCTVFESWHLKPGTRRLASGLIRTYQLERFSNGMKGACATGRLEDSGRQNDEKMWRETVHSQSYAPFFCHFAVLSAPAVLLRKLPNDNMEPSKGISFM